MPENFPLDGEYYLAGLGWSTVSGGKKMPVGWHGQGKQGFLLGSNNSSYCEQCGYLSQFGE